MKHLIARASGFGTPSSALFTSLPGRSKHTKKKYKVAIARGVWNDEYPDLHEERDCGRIGRRPFDGRRHWRVMDMEQAITVQRGRPRALTETEIAEAQKLYWDECLPVRAIADVLSVSHMTVWRAVCAPPMNVPGQEN